jgi:ABC-type sugar transport system permease subunit
MMEGGHWMIPTLQKYIASEEIRVGVAPIPRAEPGKPSQTVLYEAGWCVAKGTKYPDLAAELAIYLSSAEANRQRMARGLALPSNRSLEAEVIRSDTLGLEEVFYREVPNAREPWGTRVERFGRVQDIAEDAYEEIVIGGRDVETALTEAAERIDSELSATPTVALSGRKKIHLFVILALGGVVACVVNLLVLNRKRNLRTTGWAMGFLLPSLIHLAVFSLGPALFVLYLSFHSWSILDEATPFVGLANFRSLLGDRLFWKSLANTAVFSLNVPATMILALFLASLLNMDIRGKSLFRTLFFLPSVCSLVALAMVWQWLYNPEYGLLNYLLGIFGISPVGWLTSPRTAMPSIMIMTVWITAGYQMVIFLAGLQGIPKEMYEAARIDGANRWQSFRHVTLPLLWPTTFFVLVTSVIGSFQVFTSIYIMTQGGPLHSTDVLAFHIYQNAWEYLRMGYASAASWMLFMLIMVITMAQFKIIGRRVEHVYE